MWVTLGHFPSVGNLYLNRAASLRNRLRRKLNIRMRNGSTDSPRRTPALAVLTDGILRLFGFERELTTRT
jgi:hypothetical protein